MYKYVFGIIVLFSVLCPVLAQQSDTGYATQVIVVQFEPNIFMDHDVTKTGLHGFDDKASQYGVYSITRMYPFLDYLESTHTIAKNLSALQRTYYVHYHADVAPNQIAGDFMKEEGVTYAEPVHVHQIIEDHQGEEPDDPFYDQQGYLNHLRLPEAWELIKGEERLSDVVIAIVDTGTEWNHEDLLANQWVNVDEVAGNNIDDDQNGFVDDIRGVNFCDQDVLNHDPGVINDQNSGGYHGTAVAGVASAVRDNGIGIAGAAWNAQLMHIKVDCAPFEQDYFYEGVLYAAMNGADIINASWGKTDFVPVEPSRSIAETLDLATDLGSLVIASAGNRSFDSKDFPHYPARYSRVLSVGSTERDSRRLARFSAYGKTVDVFAPGVNIIATDLQNRYFARNGTSYSAPLVAGIAALTKARFPEMTADGLREHLRHSSENIDDDNLGYLHGRLGRGFINAYTSLQPPQFPGIRVRKWSWSDDDGDRQIDSGDEVTINIQLINHLLDAQNATIEMVPSVLNSFITLEQPEILIGHLPSNDSMDVVFRFNVGTNAGLGQTVHFYPRIRDGAFVDDVDVFTFGINLQTNITLSALNALYHSTNGDSWHNNKNWNTTNVNSVTDLTSWYGVKLTGLALTHLNLENNNLRGAIPEELGNLSQIDVLGLKDNSLSGEIPQELGNLVNAGLISMENNSLTGPIPKKLGNLTRVIFLYLHNNVLSGEIPRELGQLWRLRNMNLSRNQLSGVIPEEFGQLSELRKLIISHNELSGTLPRTLMQLTKLEELDFGGQQLCAPSDAEFQQWLKRIATVRGPSCSGFTFTSDIQDQSYTRGESITPIVLPEAVGGQPPITYTLQPDLPSGLTFDDESSAISGTPVMTFNQTRYEYSATDANLQKAGISFSIEVVSPVSSEHTGIPKNFILHGNYPNPFSQRTHIKFDLPSPSSIVVEVFDLMGRSVLTTIPKEFGVGWGNQFAISGDGLSNGVYIYRVHVSSAGGQSEHHGNFLRVQ
ncbi:MAG: S8 family serine peptidase [Bacteroidetes bacterium]|nr:S8 family serine peptidase [Bacteroidota bacterium]